MAAVAGHYDFGASKRHSEFREVEGCGAMADGLCENASRILQISALEDAGTTLKIIPLSSLVSARSFVFQCNPMPRSGMTELSSLPLINSHIQSRSEIIFNVYQLTR